MVPSQARSSIATTLNSGSPITARYEWDFGDPNGKYNALTGFNASHVYDAPGTYTVTLKVTDDVGRSTTVTQTVTVAAVSELLGVGHPFVDEHDRRSVLLEQRLEGVTRVRAVLVVGSDQLVAAL